MKKIILGLTSLLFIANIAFAAPLTTGTIPKAAAGHSTADSTLSESGSTVTASGTFVATTALKRGANNVCESDGTNCPSSSGGPGHVTNLLCTDDIQTKATAATAGDTLKLGSCTYAPAATVNFPPGVSIDGSEATIIDIGSASVSPIFSFTGDNSTVSNLTFKGTNFGMAIKFDCSATTACQNNNFKNIRIIGSNASASVDGIYYYDSGGFGDNFYMKLTGNESSTGQYRGLRKDAQATQDADTILVASNGFIDLYDTNASFASQMRAVFHWENGASHSPTNSTLILRNVWGRCHLTAGGLTSECLQNQGNNTAPNPGVNGALLTYVYGGGFDGNPDNITCASTNCRNYRIDDYAQTWFNGTLLGSGTETSQNNATVTNVGVLRSNAYKGDAPVQANAALSARPIFSLIGQQGGIKTGTGSQTGLTGGGLSLTGGGGGAATAATTTGTGGPGGEFALTSGAGSDQTTATATTNVGGVGGNIKIYGGNGGNGSAAATTNNGGNGGNIYVAPGDNGTGASANGSDGNTFIGINDSGTKIGNVYVGTLTTGSGRLVVSGNSTSSGNSAQFQDSAATPIVTIQNNGNVAVGSSTASQPFEVYSSTAASTFLRVNFTGASSSTNVTGLAVISDDGAALSSGDRFGNIALGGARNSAHTNAGQAVMSGYATENWSATVNGSALVFETTPNGSTTRAERMRLDQNGFVGIGTGSTSPAQPLEFMRAGDPIMRFSRNDATVTSGEIIGQAEFWGNDTQSTTQGLFGKIVVSAGQDVTTDASAGDMRFFTTGIAAAGAPVEVMKLSMNQHMNFTGTAPALTSCGTSPSIVGTDQAFTITVGTTASGCTATFNKAYTNDPPCTVTNQNASVVNAMTYTHSTTAVTISQTALDSSKIDVVCLGRY